jgi:phosphoribosyl-ATP pyrophosphohydrolase
MPLINQASHAIEHMTARERRIQRAKYARRNKMHYIDKLLNELEMLNLADQRQMPPVLSVAINKVIEESPEVTVLAQAKPASVMEAMDALYEIQDSLMYNQIEDE